MEPEALQLAIVEAIQDARLRQKAGESSSADFTDELTGLLTLNGFLERLDREIARVRTSGSPLCALMLELDAFAKITESHGQPVGDLALSTLAKILLRYARATDILGRYDGQRLCVATTESDLKRAQVMAERIRERTALQILTVGEKIIRVTCSIGLAELTAETGSAQEVVQRADDALRSAQEAGGNRIIPPAPGDVSADRW